MYSVWHVRAVCGLQIAGNRRGVINNTLLACLHWFWAHNRPFPFKPEFH
jgi:hypothetical protein